MSTQLLLERILMQIIRSEIHFQIFCVDYVFHMGTNFISNYVPWKKTTLVIFISECFAIDQGRSQALKILKKLWIFEKKFFSNFPPLPHFPQKISGYAPGIDNERIKSHTKKNNMPSPKGTQTCPSFPFLKNSISQIWHYRQLTSHKSLMTSKLSAVLLLSLS